MESKLATRKPFRVEPKGKMFVVVVHGCNDLIGEDEQDDVECILTSCTSKHMAMGLVNRLNAEFKDWNQFKQQG